MSESRLKSRVLVELGLGDRELEVIRKAYERRDWIAGVVASENGVVLRIETNDWRFESARKFVAYLRQELDISGLGKKDFELDRAGRYSIKYGGLKIKLEDPLF